MRLAAEHPLLAAGSAGLILAEPRRLRLAGFLTPHPAAPLVALAGGYRPLAFRRVLRCIALPLGIRNLPGPPVRIDRSWRRNGIHRHNRAEVGFHTSNLIGQVNETLRQHIRVSGQCPVHGAENLLGQNLAGKAASGAQSRIVAQAPEQRRYTRRLLTP